MPDTVILFLTPRPTWSLSIVKPEEIGRISALHIYSQVCLSEAISQVEVASGSKLVCDRDSSIWYRIAAIPDAPKMWVSTRFHASKSTLAIPDSSYNAALPDRTIHLQKVIPCSTYKSARDPV